MTGGDLTGNQIVTIQRELGTALVALGRRDLAQEAFVTAVDQFLQNGGGVVSFHHGIYRTAGKESMVDLLGAEATGDVPWDTIDGQNVIAVAPGGFVATYGVDYNGTIVSDDMTLDGVEPPVMYWVPSILGMWYIHSP